MMTIVSRLKERGLGDLILRLKDLSIGETDLTKILPVKSINCSSVHRCGKIECPSYGKKAHCWYEAGSYAPEIYCPKILNGVFQSCEECKVYKKAIRNIRDEISTFLNAFILRISSIINKGKEQGRRVKDSCKRLMELSRELLNSAETSKLESDRLQDVSSLIEEGISSIASGLEEMTATIAEISGHASEARETANEAREKSEETQDIIRKLSDSSNKINEISKLIGEIAEQTNLLALNAAIEAARAGEAGKGFAVVAHEVKELAKQTGESIGAIEDMVAELQEGAEKALSAIQAIYEIIQRVAESNTSIASAVEEQSATTNELSENASRINTEMKTLLEIEKKLQDIGKLNFKGAEEVRKHSGELSKGADDLLNTMEEFKTA